MMLSTELSFVGGNIFVAADVLVFDGVARSQLTFLLCFYLVKLFWVI